MQNDGDGQHLDERECCLLKNGLSGNSANMVPSPSFLVYFFAL